MADDEGRVGGGVRPLTVDRVDQAMGVPAGRPLAAAYLRNFVENLKASGKIAKILARNGQANAIIAPAG